MGLKLKVCMQCGQRKKIGRTKVRCKACRRLTTLRREPLGHEQMAALLANKRQEPVKRQQPAATTNYDGNSYTSRNAILMKMGFKSYQDYLQSKLWRSIRAKAFATLGSACRLCGATAKVIHHLDYSRDTLLGVSFGSLAPLCDTCHGQVEFNGECKLSVAQMRGKYSELLKGAAIP